MIGSSEEVVCSYNPGGKGPPMRWFIKGKFENKPCTVTNLIVRDARVVAVIVVPHDFPMEIRFDADEEGGFPGLEYEDSKQGHNA